MLLNKVILFLLTSCTVSPLLERHKGDFVATEMIEYNITPSKLKDAYILKRKLNELFSGIKLDIKHRYSLSIHISKTSHNVVLYKDATVGRDETTYKCEYTLTDQNTGKIKISDIAILSESHNALFSSSNIIESTYGSANDNQIATLAEKIFNHIVMVLNEN